VRASSAPQSTSWTRDTGGGRTTVRRVSRDASWPAGGLDLARLPGRLRAINLCSPISSRSLRPRSAASPLPLWSEGGGLNAYDFRFSEIT
jgi:hypothetical protein